MKNHIRSQAHKVFIIGMTLSALFSTSFLHHAAATDLSAGDVGDASDPDKNCDIGSTFIDFSGIEFNVVRSLKGINLSPYVKNVEKALADLKKLQNDGLCVGGPRAETCDIGSTYFDFEGIKFNVVRGSN